MSPKKQSDESLGRFLSLVLRHQPQAAYITLDRHGWADIEKLLAGCVRAGKSMDRETLEQLKKLQQIAAYLEERLGELQ